jgi:(p)ppGpp synthase/HD superfamily hydrolase
MDDMDNASVIHTARSIATVAHTGQVDKTGHPYIEHPTRVAERVVALFPDAPPEVVAAALLHDVIEDTLVTETDLIAAGIPASVVEAVEAVTKREGEPVERYFARVRTNPWAVMVKTADIADNTDPARVAQLDPETRDRLHTKYTRARALLHRE